MTDPRNADDGGLRLTEAERARGFRSTSGGNAVMFSEHEVERILADRLAAVQAEHSPGETCAEADERAADNWRRAEAAEAERDELAAGTVSPPGSGLAGLMRDVRGGRIV